MAKRMSRVSSSTPSSSTKSTGSVVQHSEPIAPSEEAIAHRAYEKFVARGYAHGSDREDWTSAHQELSAELGRDGLSSHRTVL